MRVEPGPDTNELGIRMGRATAAPDVDETPVPVIDEEVPAFDLPLPDDPTLDELLAWVGEFPARAEEKLVEEQAKASPRPEFVDALTDLLGRL